MILLVLRIYDLSLEEINQKGAAICQKCRLVLYANFQNSSGSFFFFLTKYEFIKCYGHTVKICIQYAKIKGTHTYCKSPSKEE